MLNNLGMERYMNYSIYKLDFNTGVHFGTGVLSESEYTFRADQLFSALYIEAVKRGSEKEFFDAISSGKLLFSDAFPYKGSQYMLPKPMMYIETTDKGNSEKKKAYKKMKFIPVEFLNNFLSGTMDVEDNPMKDYGHYVQQTMAGVRTDGETQPFRVGTYYYNDDCGLYIIVAHETDAEKILVEELLELLSYVGIGGKKTAGLGKFELKYASGTDKLVDLLKRKARKSMLLSTALPKDEELENALEGATYLIERRSGFVASDQYADELRKKKDLYVFASGSCFVNRFDGDIIDVSDGGGHKVYRYAKPIFIGI